MLSHSRRRRDTKVVFLLGTSEVIVCHWVCAHGRIQIKSFWCLQGIQMGEEVLLGACYNNFAPPKSTKMVGRRRAIEVTGAGITGRFNAVCLASDRTTATSSWSPLHPPLAMALIPRIQAQERQWDRPTDRLKVGGWIHQPPLHSLSSTGGSFTAAPPLLPKAKALIFTFLVLAVLAWSVPLLWCNQMIWDFIGLVANPPDCIEVIKCSDACCVQLPQI
jgi:hypothetical protein